MLTTATSPRKPNTAAGPDRSATIPPADPATDPLGAQAAGAACAGNHVTVIVPCHRVVRADGRLGGYGWGVPRKSWLLEHEGATRAAAEPAGQPALFGSESTDRAPAA